MKTSVEETFKDALQQYVQGILISAQDVFVENSDLLKNPNSAVNSMCIAYSGGLDSTVLLHLADAYCQQNKIRLSAIHVNHGISPYALEWQTHCETQCKQRNILFHSKALFLKKTPQQSLEADARTARYDAIEKLVDQDELVLLAQHQNDQAETFLLQLKRGAGVKGLAAMPMLSVQTSGVKYLRPLLKITRSDLLQYANKHGLVWVEDESNSDNSYDRNFLRNQVIPLLAQRWPAYSKTVARSARHCAQANEVNNEYMQLLSNKIVENGCIQLNALLTHTNATKECFVRYWLLNEFKLTPSSAQLQDIMKMVTISNQDLSQEKDSQSPHIKLFNHVIERYKGELLVTQVSSEFESETNSTLCEIIWTANNSFKLNKQYTLVRVTRNCKGNENVFSLPEKGVMYVFGGSNLKFKHKANRPTKKLKYWYQEWTVSPIQRQQVPVFVINNQAIVIGLTPSKTSCIDVNNEILVELQKN